MAILAGPALCFQGIQPDVSEWRVSVLLVETAEGHDLVSIVSPVGAYVDAGIILAQRNDGTIMRRFLISIPMTKEQQVAIYAVGGSQYEFNVPSKDGNPWMAYGSCNGFSDERFRDQFAVEEADVAEVGVKKKHPDANWNTLYAKHRNTPYHLLVLGGDQVYADAVRPALSELRRRQKWSRAELHEQEGVVVQQMLDEFYFSLYLDRWQDMAIRKTLAEIPAITMWDDHDIIDGWGSLGEIQNTKLYKILAATADRYFRIFQRHQGQGLQRGPEYLTHNGHTVGYRFGGSAILVLDLRSERTMERVMSARSWTEILGWLEDIGSRLPNQRPMEHLFVVSSIPVLHPSFHALESALGVLPGTQELEDDLRDHWTSSKHQDERLRLIKRLLSFANDSETCVTFVSGDVHVGAHGLIESTRRAQRRPQDVIHQLTSSGIVHPPPPGVMLFGLNRLLDDEQDIDTFIRGKMQIFKGIERRFIGARNWLSIEPNQPGQRNAAEVYVKWYIEDVPDPYTIGIEGPERSRP